MNKKAIFAAVLAVVGTLTVGISSANAPPAGTEQFEEWFAPNGQLNGYVHWTCDGSRVVNGTRSGRLVVTRRAC